MLLFRNSYTVSFFLCRVRTAQPSQTQSRSQFSTCCCTVWKCSAFLQVYSSMPDDRLERKRKGNSKNRNAMWKTYYWLNILQASIMKTKTQFQGYCQCSLSPPFSNLRSSGSKFTVLKNVRVTLLGFFGAPAVFQRPLSDSAPW